MILFSDRLKYELKEWMDEAAEPVLFLSTQLFSEEHAEALMMSSGSSIVWRQCCFSSLSQEFPLFLEEL